MANEITLKALQDASLDAKSLEEVVNGNEVKQVTTRKGETYPSVKKAIKTLFENGGLPATPFATKALMTASALVDGDYALVADDTDDNNGLYIKTAGVWVKSAYDVNNLIYELTTLSFDNKFINGDFSKGIAPWSRDRATLTADNNIGRMVLTGEANSGFIRQTISTTVGHKHLVKARFRVQSSLCDKIELGTSKANGALGNDYLTITKPNGGEWIEFSDFAVANKDLALFMFVATYPTAEIASGQVIEIDYIELIDVDEAMQGKTYSENKLLEFVKNKSAPYILSIKDFASSYLQDEEDVANFLQLNPDSYMSEGFDELHKEDTLVAGAVEHPSGEITTSGSSFRFTGFIDISKYHKLELSNFEHSDKTYAIYDGDKRPIIVKNGNSDDDYILNGIIELPPNAVYFARTLITTNTEPNRSALSIKGYYGRSRVNALALTDNTLAMASTDKDYVQETLTGSVVDGEFDGISFTKKDSGYSNTGYIKVADYDFISFKAFPLPHFKRYWLDENYELLSVMDYDLEPESYILRGYLKKPKGTHYLVANLKSPSYDYESAVIDGFRKLNTSDFQRKGSSGDVSQGWETSTTDLSTQKMLKIYNPDAPDVKPLKIYHVGVQPDYDYGSRINFDTEITRVGWGIQIAMNLHRPNIPNDLYAVKNLDNENGLVAEWGVEGFSWHVCPAGRTWDKTHWMAFKLGGHSVKSLTNTPLKNGTKAQFLVPTWMERTDGRSAGWQHQLSSDKDDIAFAMPSHTYHRSSNTYASPDNYNVGYSEGSHALWDQNVRSRGTASDPQAVQAGDVIKREVFSVTTGQDESKNPITKDVAMIEVVYKEDASNYEAEFVFKLKNKNTGEWDEVAKH